MDESSVEDDLSVLDAPEGADERNNGDGGTSEQPAEQPAAEGRRWTCEACGCNTNPITDDSSEADRSCSVCGTSQSSGTYNI